MNGTGQVDKSKICQCFNSLQNPNEGIRNQALEYLAGCEQQKSFLPSLFEIYKSSNDQGIKLNSIIYVHELIKHQLRMGNYMRRKRMNKPKYTDEEIKFTRQSVVKALLGEYNRAIREKLNQIVALLSREEFPKHFGELFEYMKHVLGKINEGLKNKTFKPDKQGLYTLKTISESFKELQICRRKFSPSVYKDFSREILNLFVPIWKQFEKAYLAKMEIAAEYSLITDEIFVNLLRLGNHQVLVEDPTFRECFKQLLNKSQQMVSSYKGMVDKGDFDEDIVEIVEQNITVLTYELVKIQKYSPISFEGLISEFLNYSLMIMNESWKRANVPKNAMLMMFTTMNVFEYHTNPQNVRGLSTIYKKMGVFPEKQLKCYNEFHKFFSENNKIEKIINTLLTKTMLIQETEEDETEIEAAINNSVDLKLQKINREIDFTPRQIGLAIIDRFIRILTTDTLTLVKKLVENTINGNLDNLDISIRNNIISILNGLPKTLMATGMKDFKSVFNIKEILNWVNNNSQIDKRLVRRFPALISSWYDILEEDMKGDLFRALIQMINVNDKVTEYHVLKAIGKFVRQSNDQNFNYGELLIGVTPKIFGILKEVKSTWLVFEMIGVLAKIVMKLIKTEQFDLNIHLQCINIDILLKDYDFMIAGSLFDLIQDIICTYPYGKEMPQLYVQAVKLIHKCLPNMKSEDDALLYFWRFIVKEIPNTEPNKPIINELVSLLNNNIQAFSNYSDVSQNIKVLGIIDETMLLQPKLPFNVLEYLEKKVEWSNSFTNKTNLYRIRASVLTIYSTTIIISLQFKTFDFKQFRVCITLALDNILNLKRDLSISGMISINTQSITLFNRFFLMDAAGLIQFLNSNNIDIQKFIETWVEGNSHLTARKPLRISAIALLYSLDKFPLDVIAKHFREIMKQTTREVFKYADELQVQSKKDSKHKDRKRGYSHRKAELRNLQMFDEYNLIDVFKQSVQKFQNSVKGTNIQTPDFSDEAGQVLQGNIVKILNSNF